MNPSLVSPKFYEISDISYSHTVDPGKEIRTSIFEKKISFHPTQSFSSDSSILNYVQSFPVKAQGDKERFDSSLSNHVAGVHKSGTLDVLEEISYFRSDPFTLIDLELPTNSYMIACTNTQSFVEEGEN